MMKHKLLLAALGAAALGGAYYYTRKHGGLTKVASDLRAKYARAPIAATATVKAAPAPMFDDEKDAD